MKKKSRLGWLDVDLSGLRQTLERRSKDFIVYELVQNAWDEESTQVEITLPRPVNGKTQITVIDNAPNGFRDLTHAFTLFASSAKKSNPCKRGLFNAGEKFVLACCEEASIISTIGAVKFDRQGRRRTRKRRTEGSQFSGLITLSTSDWEHICEAVRRLIPPVATTFNGEPIAERKPLCTCHAVLPSVMADERGELRRTERKTEIRIYEPLPGETATLYEMGIPVVATGDRWHVDVQQKVPLNMERDNVTPGYLRAIRVTVLNEMSHHLTTEDASDTWVRDATGDSRACEDAVRKVIDLRFGAKHVTFDPYDKEANLLAASEGYTVIPPASLSGNEWNSVKKYHASLPAGRVTPSPKPFSADGSPLVMLAENSITKQFRRFERFAKDVAEVLIDRYVVVNFANDQGWSFGGCYGDARLIVNVAAKGMGWFEGSDGQLLENWTPFLIHEFAHEAVKEHLSAAYHAQCCRLAGILVRALVEQPHRFNLLLKPRVSVRD